MSVPVLLCFAVTARRRHGCDVHWIADQQGANPLAPLPISRQSSRQSGFVGGRQFLSQHLDAQVVIFFDCPDQLPSRVLHFLVLLGQE